MEHFRLEQVADDAWAAIALPGTGTVGNAGFVRSTERTRELRNVEALRA